MSPLIDTEEEAWRRRGRVVVSRRDGLIAWGEADVALLREIVAGDLGISEEQVVVEVKFEQRGSRDGSECVAQ